MSNTPKIRFDGFTDDWEQRKLEKYIIEYTETTTENNQYPALTSSRKGIFLQTEYFSGNQIASADNTGYNIVPYGYFTYRHMSDDEIFYFNINDIVENGIVSTLYPVFTTTKDLDSRYLQYQLNYGSEFSKFAILQKQGGSRTYMYLSKLKKLKLTMPVSVEEQNHISKYFMNLDKLITLHQRKCATLQKFKKSMLQKMFPQNGESVPEIRFDGFTDAWEQRKLSDTLDFLSNNTLSRAELSEDTGTYKNVHYGDVLIKFGEYIDAQSTDLPFIADNEKAKKFESSKLQDGDIIIADTAEDEAVGKCVEIGNIGDLSIVSGLHTIPCRPKVKFAPAYLGFYLNSASYHDQLIPLMQGIKVTSISKSAISDTMISAPTNLSEQGKIGQFFTQLDTLITLHQRKLETLQKMKKALLQKMFV
ncbi:MAG: restriction endonuclease subunit S [Ruminococcus sp.]|nr:restriction endonuclease subunit S [Ruminococcus sp.]